MDLEVAAESEIIDSMTIPEGTRPIDHCMDRWHQHIRGELPGGLDGLLHDDVTFFSPVVFTPQQGKQITMLYLGAAGNTLGDNDPAKKSGEAAPFKYTKELRDGNHCLMEFETSMDGKHVNGVDLITCDDHGQIIEFKVMIRPLQAVHAVHQAMGAMLDKMG